MSDVLLLNAIHTILHYLTQACSDGLCGCIIELVFKYIDLLLARICT